MKLIAALALVASLLVTPASAQLVRDEPASIDYNAIAIVECDGYRGTAWWVARDRIITAYHVTGERSCSIGGVPLRRVSADALGDVVELTGLSNRHVLRVACSAPRAGAVFHGSGFAGARFRHTSRLVATGARDDGASEPIARGMYVFDGEGAAGMSGGPVFDRRGRVVAMINRGTRTPPCMMQGRALVETHLCGAAR